nr:uncharacterized protein LOC109187108 isoform X2 [Ipomoea batatas]
MESNRHSPSVIARLMGLDEPLPQQPVYKQRRILSETYLRKSASIVLREKSSFSVGHSSSMNTKKRKAIKDAFEDNLPRYVQEENKLLDVRNFPSEYCLGHSAVCKSSSASKYRNNEICKKSDIMSEGNILSSLQELETGNANSRSRTEPTLYGSCLWQKDDVRNENKCMKQSQKHYVELGDRRIVIPEKKSASRFYKCNPGLSNSESKSLAFTRNAAGSMANANTKGNGISFMNFENLHSEPSPCSLSTGDDLSSNSWEASFKQESLNESPPNRLVPLKDTIIDPNSTMNLKEAKQSSPISVLEPHFKARKLRNSECYDGPVVDLHSVVKQLKLLETSSEETYSEGSEMAVSSVENNEKRSFYFSQELLGVFSSEESRDFSYLVDVLDEAHLNFEVDFKTCNSLESPINPLLFEALEKKYGKQISWLKSERRLLFDRINSWLSEILNSFTDIHVRSKSLKMMFHPTLRRSEVEEELWMLLVNEEKEVGKDLSEKALGVETKWLKMESEISNICKEVENYLFDELVAELFCV